MPNHPFSSSAIGSQSPIIGHDATPLGMRTMDYLRALCLLILLAPIGACQNQSSKSTVSKDNQDTLQIIDVLTTQRNAWNDGDIDGYMAGYHHSDSLKFITRHGVRMGYDSIASRYKRAYPNKEKMGHLEFTRLQCHPISQVPRIYQVTGNWKIIGKDSASGNFSLLMQKFDREWKIIVDHTW